MIFTSDHGDGVERTAGTRNRLGVVERGGGGCLPLIVTLPGKKECRQGDAATRGVTWCRDFFAAVCDWAGIRLPEGLHGVSISGDQFGAEKADPSLKHQDYIVTETTFDKGGNTRGWALRTSRYKYVLYDKGRYREQSF